MDIDFYKDNKYPKTQKTNNNTERRENTYQPQTVAKKTVDNSSSLMYNKSKGNKEPYLKDTQPLQTYIDAKDEFEKITLMQISNQPKMKKLQ